MDQRGRLQGDVLTLSCQLPARHLVQLIEDKWHQLIQGRWIAGVRVLERVVVRSRSEEAVSMFMSKPLWG